MRKLIKRILGWIYSTFLNELRFLGRIVFRFLEIITQIFPEDSRGCRIRGFLYKPFLKKCGRNFQVGIGAKLEHLQNIEIGDDVYIGHGCWISGVRGGISLHDEVMFGPFVKVVSSNHTPVSNSFRFGPGVAGHISIGKGTWVAANVVITAGALIGECCLIAAGSVVTKNFNSYSIIGGIPARVIGSCIEKYNIQFVK